MSIYEKFIDGVQPKPDLAYTSLDALTSMFNCVDDPRKDVSDFILECARVGIPGTAGVRLTKESISLME